VWNAYRPDGLARLLIARLPDSEPAAALFLVRCGTRVVEPYGGMTQAGAASRANYLLKWEAIRSSRDAGAATYDLWGLAHPGIAHFKTGFGGREVRYIGSWDLVLDGVGRAVYGVAQRGRVWVARRRHGLPAAPTSAPGTGGDAAGDGADDSGPDA
jgi:lipid II:glycine glycyltransferase (peptidoglycan interpeptide bridge formation enzyme)